MDGINKSTLKHERARTIITHCSWRSYIRNKHIILLLCVRCMHQVRSGWYAYVCFRVLHVAWLHSVCRQPSSCCLPTTASQLPRFQVESAEEMPGLLLVPNHLLLTAGCRLSVPGAVCCRDRCACCPARHGSTHTQVTNNK